MQRGSSKFLKLRENKTPEWFYYNGCHYEPQLFKSRVVSTGHFFKDENSLLLLKLETFEYFKNLFVTFLP